MCLIASLGYVSLFSYCLSAHALFRMYCRNPQRAWRGLLSLGGEFTGGHRPVSPLARALGVVI